MLLYELACMALWPFQPPLTFPSAVTALPLAMHCRRVPLASTLLEGQVRIATDKEIYVIAKLLGVAIEELFEDAMEE